MRIYALFFIVFLLLLGNASAYAQENKDVCDLITAEQINNILGGNLTGDSSLDGGRYCIHRSPDGKIVVSLQYFDWHDEKKAETMLKITYDGNNENIFQGKKTDGIYTNIKPLFDSGQNVFVMTGEDYATFSIAARIMFTLDGKVFTFSTQGIDKKKVLAKAQEIYAAIKKNSK